MNDESGDDFVDFREITFTEEDWYNFKDTFRSVLHRGDALFDTVYSLLDEGSLYGSHHPKLTKIIEDVVDSLTIEGVIVEWKPWEIRKQWWSYHWKLECPSCGEVVTSKYRHNIFDSCCKNELGETEEEEQERIAYMDDNYPEWRDDGDYGGDKHRYS